MTQYNRPSASVPVWAESGDKVQPTNAEVQTGWPLSNVPPSRQRFNWLENFLSNGLRYLLQRGISDWASGEDYPQYAKVSYNGLTYRALINQPTSAPGVVAGEWEVWGYSDSTIQARTDSILTKSVAGGVDVTLTAAEAGNGILVFTGALTANINVILPNSARRWAVFNNTSGSFALSVKTSGGSGLQIQQSSTKAYSIFCNGSNGIYMAGASADASISTTQFTATAGQTSFGMTYTVGSVFLVTRNGADVAFTASTGTTVVLTSAASNGDIVKVYTCTAFQVANAVAKSGDTMSGPLTMSGAAINEAQGANIASAATVNLSAATGNYVHITGTTTITAITLSQGQERTVVFDGALTLTNGASLIIPGGTVTTAAGDVATFRGEASGVVRCVDYVPGNGYPLLAGFGSSLASSGYQKLPSGMIVQWGSVTTGGGGNATGAFPFAFPNACFSFIQSVSNASAANQVCTGAATSASAFSVAVVGGSNGASVPGVVVNYIAIGR